MKLFGSGQANEDYEELVPIYKTLVSRSISLSIQKFSSNVIEKCLQLKNEKNRKMFIDTLFIRKNLVELIKNKFGSYVLTKAVKFCDNSERQKYIELICEEVNQKNMSKHKGKWNELFRKNWPQFYPVLYQKYIEKGSQFSSSSFENFSNIGIASHLLIFNSSTTLF